MVVHAHVLLLFSLPCVRAFIPAVKQPATRRSVHGSFRHAVKQTADVPQSGGMIGPGAKALSTETRRNFLKAGAVIGTYSATSPVGKAYAAAPPSSAGGFQGFYTDPGHPKGYRVVRSTGKDTAVVELQDDPTGEVLNIAAKVVEKTGQDTQILIDFSVKGGPKDVTAVYKDGGLVFPDGNKWPKVSSGFQGLYTDPGHPKGYRIVRSTGKDTAVVELQDDPKGEVLNIAAKVVEKNGQDTQILIDFSVKGGPKDVTAVYKDGGLVFPDGNKWPKTV